MYKKSFSLSLSLGAIFDTFDTLSRQAFEYTVAKINIQSKILNNSKIIVSRINMVDAYDSFSAYKMGKMKLFHFSVSKSIISLFSN